MKSFPSSDLKQHVGDVLEAAETGPVTITKHDKPRYVLMSAKLYERRIKNPDPRRAYSIDDMPDDVAAMLIEGIDKQISELDHE